MERPEIVPENYQEVYDYYRQYEPMVRPIRLAYAAFHGIFQPRVSFADQAQGELEDIQQTETPRIYVFNHLTNYDQFIVGSTLHEIAPDDIGRIRTLGADFNFRRFYGKFSDIIGGVPVFRRVDHGDATDLNLRDVHEELFNTFRDFLAEGQVVAGFPEGVLNKTDDPTRLVKVRSGIGEIAHRAAVLLDKPIAIEPIGISYGLKRLKITKPFHTSVYVDRPFFAQPDESVGEITEHARIALQDAVTQANKLYLP